MTDALTVLRELQDGIEDDRFSHIEDVYGYVVDTIARLEREQAEAKPKQYCTMCEQALDDAAWRDEP